MDERYLTPGYAFWRELLWQPERRCIASADLVWPIRTGSAAREVLGQASPGGMGCRPTFHGGRHTRTSEMGCQGDHVWLPERRWHIPCVTGRHMP